MTRVYLKDLEPAEVIDRLHEGQIVYYTDTKGKKFQYQMYRGVLWRYNRDTHEVDGYNRSIYSTGECYFEEDGIRVQVGKHYRTRSGGVVYILRACGSWFEGDLYASKRTLKRLSWTSKGRYIDDCIDDGNDLIKELD